MARDEEDIEKTGIYSVDHGDRVTPAHRVKQIPRIQRVKKPRAGVKRFRLKRAKQVTKYRVKGGRR